VEQGRYQLAATEYLTVVMRGFMPGIHVLKRERRGWPRQAGHDEKVTRYRPPALASTAVAMARSAFAIATG
jgi:hypothetical protein